MASAEPHSIDRNILDVVRDTGRTIARHVVSENGLRLAGFDAIKDTLKAEIWPGDGQPAIEVSGLQAYWTDATTGDYAVVIPPLDDVLTSAVYSIRVVMTSGGSSRELYRGRIRVLDAPGDFPCKLTAYCTYRDVLDHAPWIDSLQTDVDRSGFQRQRSAAKNWIDLAIIKRAKLNDNDWHSQSNYIYYGVVPPGFAYSGHIRSLISGGKIIVDQNLRDIAAYYTIHLICETQFSPQGAYGPYLDISRRMYGMAAQRLETAIIQFDSSGDGQPDISIEIGRVMGGGRS